MSKFALLTAIESVSFSTKRQPNLCSISPASLLVTAAARNLYPVLVEEEVAPDPGGRSGCRDQRGSHLVQRHPHIGHHIDCEIGCEHDGFGERAQERGRPLVARSVPAGSESAGAGHWNTRPARR
ncbi:hypothetical protein [Nocardia sp. NPDC051981]|uniref:hypothetical protein n=1 Tax=Nocardia sp. NPDC051981 TaxID=3155417 RepID=UPI003448BFFC